jgi:hypothetical protein
VTIAPDVLHTLATELSASILQALTDYTRPLVNRLYVASGTPELVAWDDCCESAADPDAEPGALPPQGQLTVAMERLYRTRAFPVEDVAVRGNCDETRLAVTYVVELTRCSSVVDEEDDKAPTADTLDTEGLLTDTLAIARGISCQVNAWNNIGRNAVFGGITPIGPAGTCVGNRGVVTVEAVSSCICETITP